MSVTESSGIDTRGQHKVSELFRHILEINPLHRRFLEAAVEFADTREVVELSEYLEYCEAAGKDLEYIADCYMTIVEDTLREQIYFMKHGDYRNKSFADVASDVYFDSEYMNRYMYGLAVSSFVWPNHLAMSRFFVETLPRSAEGNYLEIGPGHGYYTMKAMQLGAYESIKAVDISETSLAQTRDVIGHFLPEISGRVELLQMDFLDAAALQAGTFDTIVMGEVLEHVERPEKFLVRLKELAREDAHIYVTTCINAPAVDHIYLWRDIESLESMFSEAGLVIRRHLYLPYEGKTLDESLEQSLAVNVAYVLGLS